MDTTKPPGLRCPKCGLFIPRSHENLFKSSPIYCGQCGVELTVELNLTKQMQEALENIKRRESEAKIPWESDE